ncbi:MAG TPA: hypothetical protein VHV10_15320, partial [Ktedonobacteraceae bacterium]|nr:hypothetical protein [Ktedonobacteraceae bacterium]
MTDRGRKPEKNNNNSPRPRAASFDVYKNRAGQSQSEVEERSASVSPPARDARGDRFRESAPQATEDTILHPAPSQADSLDDA